VNAVLQRKPRQHEIETAFTGQREVRMNTCLRSLLVVLCVVGVANVQPIPAKDGSIKVPSGWYNVTPSDLATKIEKLPPQVQAWKQNYDPQMPAPNFVYVPFFTADGREYIGFYTMQLFELNDAAINSPNLILPGGRQNVRFSFREEYGRKIMQVESQQPVVTEDCKNCFIYVVDQYIPMDGQMLMVQVRHYSPPDSMMEGLRYAMEDSFLPPPKVFGVLSFNQLGIIGLGLLVLAALLPAFYLLRNRRSGDEL
jgi:hypothetical protein